MQKVLLMLCLGISCSFQLTALALDAEVSAEDKKWATDLSNSSVEMLWEHFKARVTEQEQRRSSGSETINLKNNDLGSKLYIFVSTSMPKNLLKSYYQEANNYGGILVFKGLPSGSFKELLQIVTELTTAIDENAEQLASVQIDDEVYEKFNVRNVPTIVLSKESPYHPLEQSKLEFDKITGNVGILYALEEFHQQGDLPEAAKTHLNLSQSVRDGRK